MSKVNVANAAGQLVPAADSYSSTRVTARVAVRSGSISLCPKRDIALNQLRARPRPIGRSKAFRCHSPDL